MIGTSFLAIPAWVILILTGQIWAGIGLIIFNQLIINNIDNILRPKLVDASAKIDDVLLILAVFWGMYRRGMFGILYGPVLMSFIITTFDIYKQAQK
jgi:predicted PurR-regulated permease PerM